MDTKIAKLEKKLASVCSEWMYYWYQWYGPPLDHAHFRLYNGVSRIWEREVLTQSCVKRAHKNLSHAPKLVTTPTN